MRPHGLQPTRLLRPWDSPGKNTGVSCHFLLQCMKVESESEVAQSCLTLSDPMDCSLAGSSIHGIFQARVLEWDAIAFSRKIGQLLVKNEIWTFSHIIYKNKLKMKWRPKCKLWNHKTPTRKHRQNTLWHKSQQYFLDLSPKAKKTKGKINQQDLIQLKAYVQQRKPSTKWKGHRLNGRKYFQMI